MATDNPMLGGGENNSDWATESTQKELKKLLEKKLGKYDATKIEKLLVKIEKNTKALTKATKAGGAGGVNFTKMVKSLEVAGGGGAGGAAGGGGGGGPRGIAKMISGGGGGPKAAKKAAATAKLIHGTAVAGKKLINFSSSLAKSISFTAILGTLGKVLSGTIDSYRQLMGVGHDFGGSMMEMRRQAGQAGMSFDTFTKVFATHSKIIKSVGNTSFINLQKEVRRINSGLGQFGFTVEETSAIALEYAERQVRAGRLESLSDSQRAVEVQKYMHQLTELTKITGRSRDEMMKDIQATRKNVDMRIALAGMDKATRDRVNKGLEDMGPRLASMGPELSAAITDMMAQGLKFGNLGMSEFGRVAIVVGGKFSKGAEGLIKSLKAGEETGDDLALIFESMSDMGGKEMKSLHDLSLANDAGALKVMAMMESFETMTDAQKEELGKRLNMSRKELKDEITRRKVLMSAEQKSTNDTLALQSKWQAFLGDMQAMIWDKFGGQITDLMNRILPLLSDTVFPALLSMLTFAVDHIGWLVAAFVAIKAIGFVTMLLSFGAAIAAVTSPIWGTVAVVVGLVAAVGAALIFFWNVSETFRDFVKAAADIIWNILKFTTPLGIIINLLWEFSETFRNIVGGVWEGVTGWFGGGEETSSVAGPTAGAAGEPIQGVSPGTVAPTTHGAGGAAAGAGQVSPFPSYGTGAGGSSEAATKSDKLLEELIKQGEAAQSAREHQTKYIKKMASDNNFGFSG